MLLLQACEEVVENDGDPTHDAACAVIAARIGFASPVDTMSADSWEKVVEIIQGGGSAELKIKDGVIQ